MAIGHSLSLTTAKPKLKPSISSKIHKPIKTISKKLTNSKNNYISYTERKSSTTSKIKYPQNLIITKEMSSLGKLINFGMILVSWRIFIKVY